MADLKTEKNLEAGYEKQPIATSGNHTVDALRAELAQDPELQGLTLYEKKAVLVNRELDSHGMGRYQWCIWFLCGLGYFIDLLWAEAFGLALGALTTEFDLTSNVGDLSTAFSAGLTAGAFTWGVLVDIVGRYWAFNGTCFISSIFGLTLGASNNYNTLLVLTAFCGFGVGGNIPIDTTITLEFLPQNRRFLLCLLSIFQPIGVVIAAVISLGLIPKYSCPVAIPCDTVAPGEACCDKASNYGWRYYLYTLGAITLFIFFLRFAVFRFRESPKFLLYRGKDAKAALVLEQIAHFNKREPIITLQHFEALTDEDSSIGTDTGKLVIGSGARQQGTTWGQKIMLEFSRVKYLFGSPILSYMTILVWITYMFDYLSFSAAGSFIPLILAAKGAQLMQSTYDTYVSYVIIYLPGIAGVLLGGLMYAIPFIGRKWGMVISSALQGVSLFLFAAATTYPAYIGFNVLEYFMQSMFNAILYGWTPEAFPAPMRGTACGLASFFGRILGIVAPQIGGHILYTYYGTSKEAQQTPGYGNGVLYFAGAAVFVSTISVLLMPGKRMGANSY